MRQIDDSARLDDLGRLWTLQPGKYDSFAPLGTLPQDEWKPSGYYFDSVPTYGSFLSNWWDNNPLQFASEDTAKLARQKVREVLGPKFTVEPYEEVVNVGPFRWAAKRMLRVQAVSDEPSGEAVDLCAGLEIAAFVRNPTNYAAELRGRVK